MASRQQDRSSRGDGSTLASRARGSVQRFAQRSRPLSTDFDPLGESSIALMGSLSASGCLDSEVGSMLSSQLARCGLVLTMPNAALQKPPSLHRAGARLAGACALGWLGLLLASSCVRWGFAVDDGPRSERPAGSDGLRSDSSSSDHLVCAFAAEREITVSGSAARLQQHQILISLPHPAQLAADCRDLRVLAADRVTT